MTDLTELFARDPLSLSKQDLFTIVTRMRQMRGNFLLGNAKAGSTKPLTAKQKANVELAEKLDLKMEL